MTNAAATIVLSRQEAEKKIALHKGAKWFVCHKPQGGSYGFLCFPDGYAGLYSNEEFLDALPEGYVESQHETGRSPFKDANVSKTLRDELSDLGWIVESYRDPNTRVGTVFRVMHPEGDREFMVEGEELEAVVRIYLQCVTGQQHEFSDKGAN